MGTFEAIILAAAFALALVAIFKAIEISDEYEKLKSEMYWLRRNFNMRISNMESQFRTEYEEIARIYEEEETA